MTVLLDLDDTLVLTSMLEPLRRSRRWADVYAAFPETRLPTGTADFVAAIKKRGLVGVVTTAPRSYAERLLLHHAIDLPVVVAYHDSARRKPDPAPLLLAAERLSVDPATCTHIGDQPTDEIAAKAAGMRSILVAWSASLPGRVRSWEEVLARLGPAGQYEEMTGRSE